MSENIAQTNERPLPDVDGEATLTQEAERLLDAYCAEIRKVAEEVYKRTGRGPFPERDLRNIASRVAILNAQPRLQIHLLSAILEHNEPIRDNVSRYVLYELDLFETTLFKRSLPWTAVDLEYLLAILEPMPFSRWNHPLRLVQDFQQGGNRLTPALEAGLRALQKRLQPFAEPELRKLRAQITALLGEDKALLPDPGETWASMALADIAALPEERQTAWKRLLAHAQDSEASKPTPAWRKEGKACVAAVGEASFREQIVRWFAAVTVPPLLAFFYEYQGHGFAYHRGAPSDRNLNLLKGLAWLCADCKEVEIARSLAQLIEVSLKKMPEIGPWAVRVANAAIWALTEMECAEALGQLGRLKIKLTFRTALNQIEKGLEQAAKRAGVTPADLEDLSVPTYGFDRGGLRRETFGECAALATLTPTGDIGIEWFAAHDKPVKAPPAEVKKQHADALKEFKADVDAAAKMLTAQKARFDSFYLPERHWTLKVWQERFADHPLLGTIARRLIWQLARGERSAQGIWNATQAGFVDVQDTPIPWLTEDTQVRLWHPLGSDTDLVVAWRNYLQAHGIVQPFKQAHREVYLLTEAERTTQTYSNRFAGHILKQHQMNALAGIRGWKNQLRLMVDDSNPPAMKVFPELGLRAEFWIEGHGDDGNALTESGTYLYLTTDQVRFYRVDAPLNYALAYGGGYGHNQRLENAAIPLPLTEVPALVFSEVMRDVDLFVGVCSVGNDPTWYDGGPQGRYRGYWHDYAFSDLSATARTRREVLERLLPRLKIAPRCSLTDRFLVVRGDLRTYKIHLGSGNILMEPNDQYLCIVQDLKAQEGAAGVEFLPFEGDARLALILSKAFLLAEDTRITDPTITRQIQL